MKKPAAIPAQIKRGKIVFPVWQLGDGRFAFDYLFGSERRVVKRRKFEDLEAEADRIAVLILNGETEAQELSALDCRIYVAARDALAPTGLQLDTLARDAAEVFKMTSGVSLRDLALFYKRHHSVKLKERAVTELIAEMLAEKNENDLSGRRKRELRGDLGKFRDAFGERLIADVNAPEVLHWLREMQNATGFAWKRRNHVRANVVCLFRWAQKQGYLPHDRKTAAEAIAPMKRPRLSHSISLYTPDEMRAWIANIKHHYLPWLLICGFSGARSEEVAPDPKSNKDPLRWEDFRWERRYINVRRETAKVRDEPRHVPISEQLFAWLAPWHTASGLVCPGEQPSKRETSRLSKISGGQIDGRWVQLKWKPNALRHTYISALLGLRDPKTGEPDHSRSYVAEVCGTSEAKIRTNYREPMEDEQARAWLSIMPAMPSNVIQPKLFAM